MLSHTQPSALSFIVLSFVVREVVIEGHMSSQKRSP